MVFFRIISVPTILTNLDNSQSLPGENNNQRLGGKLPSLNGGPKSGNNVAGLNEKAADKERAALLPSVSGGGGGGDGKARNSSNIWLLIIAFG